MKTKTKILAVVEIAVVLCSVFLVATLPAAAITNYESGITNYEETASEDDYVLGVYGNANEDDTIDMRDLTYVKLIFFGKKPETELADAKYDGKINPLDFIQIKLIIVGKEKELTIVDTADRIVTVKKPVKRIIPLGHGPYDAEVIRMFGAKDKIVGATTNIIKTGAYFPELSKLPSVGRDDAPDYEVVLSLNPDLVIAATYKVADFDEKLPDNIALVGLNFWKPEDMKEEVLKLAYILGKRDEAKHYIEDFHDKYIDSMKVRTEGLSEEERPKVYLEKSYKAYKAYGGGSTYVMRTMDTAGGKNIFADIAKSSIDVDPEKVVVRNPDIIIKYLGHYKATYKFGYDVDDPSELKPVRDDILSRPELAKVNAVKNGKVYLIDLGHNTGPDYPVGTAYWAKWFQPDLFEDLDPKAIHQEWLTEFQGLDYDLDEHGVFVYHPEEHPDGK